MAALDELVSSGWEKRDAMFLTFDFLGDPDNHSVYGLL
jgi:hypothetical protein